jgi:hypothetical protein
MITMHEEHQLESGEVVTVPPIPPLVPCTCGRKKAWDQMEAEHEAAAKKKAAQPAGDASKATKDDQSRKSQ